MSDQIYIREALESEVAEIMRQRRAMFQDMGFRRPEALDAMELTSEQYVRNALAGGSYHQWFAETTQRLVVGGVAVITHAWVSNPADPQARRVYVLNMYVYPEYRGKGIARALMVELIEWCRQQGFGSVSLHASEMGRPLYERLGFKPTNEMRLALSEC